MKKIIIIVKIMLMIQSKRLLNLPILSSRNHKQLFITLQVILKGYEKLVHSNFC